ncbi:MAG TPA: translocation/assembly module TamB domain-containing protein, partial [Gemmatimonadales bacterium]|nr:translocation/assembly module TamB domain-containing protein [Gemmatimonadales bacterium]
KPLIAFRDVEITDGSVQIHTGATPSNGGPQEAPRTIRALHTRLAYARIVSPLPGEEALRFELEDLAAQVSDPALTLVGATGVVDIKGDSLHMDLTDVRLPQSRGAVRGTLRWPRGDLLFDLSIRDGRILLEDIRWLNPDFPAGVTATGPVLVRSFNERVVAVRGEDVTLIGAGGRGGRLRGRLGLILGPGDQWALERTDIRMDQFDLEYWRPLLDTLPLAGRLTGRFTGDGPMDSLQVALEWTFRDSLVAGWPESRVTADGRVALGVPGGFVFHDFVVRRAGLDMGTVRRLIPLTLVGRLDGAGTLNGPWRQADFSGTLRHQDGSLPPTSLHGVLRVDARRDTVGVWANWAADSLSLDGLATSLPGLSIRGSFGGDIRLAGYLDSLNVVLNLAGAGGRVQAEGDLLLLAPPWGAWQLTAGLRQVNLASLDPAWPPTDLTGTISGSARLDSSLAPVARFEAQLGPSHVSGTLIDSAMARMVVGDNALQADTAVLWGPAWVSTGRGTLGLGSASAGALHVTLRSDSLAALEPALRWLRARGADALADSVSSGVVQLEATLTGQVDHRAVEWRANLGEVRWGDLRLRRATAGGTWTTGGGPVAVQAEADSAAWGRMSFSGLEARFTGAADSASWFARSRLGNEVSWIAGGAWRADSSSRRITLDSMGVLLPSDAWFLEHGATLTVADSGVGLDRMVFTGARGRSSVTVEGRVPGRAPGALRVSIAGLSLADLTALAQLDDPAGGEVSGTVEIGGLAADPEIRGTLALTNGVFGEFRTPYVSGTVNYRGRLLGGELELWRAGQQILEVTLSLPVDLGFKSVADRRLPGPLTVRGVADGVDLAFLEAMMPLVRQTSGRLFADLGIAGSWARPELTGSLSIENGAATFPALGVRHEQLNGRLVLSGDTIRVDRLSVRSGEGTLAVSGFVRLEELTRPVLALRLTADEFRAIESRDFVSATASGGFALTGPVLGATLTGRGTVTRGVLYFTDLISKQVIRLEDPRYAELVDTSLTQLIRRQGLGEEFQNRFLERLRIDSLALEMGGDVWLRSSEANIQLGGRLTVSKDMARYRMDGTLETPRGTYRLRPTTAVTREFVVTRGQLQYFGTPDLNATLDIDARHVVRQPQQNITVMVHLGGTLYTPTMRFTSDVRPPLAETEIMSYLLFGSSSAQAPNADQISSRVLGVLSGQLERSLIEDLGVPFDYLQIRPGDLSGRLSGTEVAVGKRVTVAGVPTFITFSPRYCPGQAIINPEEFGWSLEFRMSRQWLLAVSQDPVGTCASLGGASAVARRQLGFDLLWERTY